MKLLVFGRVFSPPQKVQRNSVQVALAHKKVFKFIELANSANHERKLSTSKKHDEISTLCAWRTETSAALLGDEETSSRTYCLEMIRDKPSWPIKSALIVLPIISSHVEIPGAKQFWPSHSVCLSKKYPGVPDLQICII